MTRSAFFPIFLSFVAVVKQKSDSLKKDDNSLKVVESNIEGKDRAV